MLREESEGFLKLFASLNSACKESFLPLIGEYDLDPNRVLDLVLQHYTKDETGLMEILKGFKASLVCQVVGFGFLSGNSETLAPVCAKLIKAGVFELQDVWGYLKPESLQDEWDEYVKNVRNLKRAFDMVIINADVTQRDRDLEKLEEQTYSNQKLCLLTDLLKLNCWSEVRDLFKKLEGKLILNSVPNTIPTLCSFLEWVMNPVIQDLAHPSPSDEVKFPSGSMSPISSASKLREFLSDYLPILGVYIGYSESTYCKVCQFLQGCKETDYVISLIEKFLLPALSFAGPEAIKSFWFLIKDLPYSRRFSIYDKWLNYNDGLVAVRQSLTVSVQVDKTNKSLDQESVQRKH